MVDHARFRSKNALFSVLVVMETKRNSVFFNRLIIQHGNASAAIMTIQTRQWTPELIEYQVSKPI